MDFEEGIFDHIGNLGLGLTPIQYQELYTAFYRGYVIVTVGDELLYDAYITGCQKMKCPALLYMTSGGRSKVLLFLDTKGPEAKLSERQRSKILNILKGYEEAYNNNENYVRLNEVSIIFESISDGQNVVKDVAALLSKQLTSNHSQAARN